MKHNLFSRFLGVLLAVVMLASLMSMPSLADTVAGTDTTAISEEQTAGEGDTTGADPTPAMQSETGEEEGQEGSADVNTDSELADTTQEPAEGTGDVTDPEDNTDTTQEPTEDTQEPADTTEGTENTQEPADTTDTEGTGDSETNDQDAASQTVDGQALLDELMAKSDEDLLPAVQSLSDEQVAALEALGDDALSGLLNRLDSITAAQDESEEPVAVVDYNNMSAEELYNYLCSLTDDAEYMQVMGSLSEEKLSDLFTYIDSVSAGDPVEVTEDRGIVSYPYAAGLVSFTAPQMAMKSMMRAASRTATLRDTSVTEYQSDGTASNDGLVTNKYVKSYEDGAGVLRLEAYVKGEQLQQEESVPVDVVLVLDQSTSMGEDISANIDRYTPQNHNNGDAYSNRNYNKTEYYALYDGTYVKVTSISRDNGRTEVTYQKRNYNRWTSYSDLYSDRNNLYISFDNGQTHYKVTVNRKSNGSMWSQYYTYTISYTDDQGQTHTLVNDARSVSLNSTDAFDNATFYRQTTQTIYTYTYTLENGQSATSEGAQGEPPYDLYTHERVTSISRLEALQTAAENFVKNLRENAAENDIINRVAVVGFAVGGEDYNNSYPRYSNTEILTLNNGNGKQYGSFNNNDYKNALVSSDNTVIDTALNNLQARGATCIDLGLEMARKILQNNPVQEGENRKQVVIVFTDGAPSSWDEYSDDVQDAAIQEAKAIKDSGATLYTIGVFDNADATVIRNNSGEPEPQSWDHRSSMSGSVYDTPSGYINKFLHILSSNYPNAANMQVDKNTITKDLDLIDPDDPSQGYESYYLSAANAEDLDSIFTSISHAIGGATIELDSTTVLQDVMSDYVSLPADAANKIKVYTVEATDVSDMNNIKWSENETDITSQIQQSVDVETGVVHVTGFDYSENYVGARVNNTTKGKKLVVEIPFETSTTTFGGNNIPTNKVTSGIYKSDGSDCYENFEVPMVNVPVNYEIAAKDQTIYLTNSADLSKLLGYADKTEGDAFYTPDGVKNKYVTITYTMWKGDTKVGTLTIDPGKNVEQSSWQWETLTDEDAVYAGPNPNLEDCTEYTLKCTVVPQPETEGSDPFGEPVKGKTYDEESENNNLEYAENLVSNGTVHILIPQVSVEDSTIDLGANADLVDNLSSAPVQNNNSSDWAHKGSDDGVGTPEGAEPSVTVKWNWVAGSDELFTDTTVGVLYEGNEENSNPFLLTQDTDFTVEVYLGTDSTPLSDENVSLTRNPDDHAQNCILNDSEETHDFTVHVLAVDGTLIIQKKVDKITDNGKAVFNFKVTNETDHTVYYYQAIVQNAGSYEEVVRTSLPVGNYTVEELSNTAYKCKSDAVVENVQVTSSDDGTTVRFENESKDNNIPTDNSGVKNNYESVGENGVVIWKDPFELGNDQVGNITQSQSVG